MIEVADLRKSYGRFDAVSGVSFTVGKGEILGFLGPNGAGKTTTMRILTGYMPATSGRATVAGYDVFKSPLEAKRSVGYLPEIPPVYPDLDVTSYLDFCARIKGVASADRKAKIDRAIEKARLGDVRHKLIGRLSKGFRQRVGIMLETLKKVGLEDYHARRYPHEFSGGQRQRIGIARALALRPQFIICDEPVSALDVSIQSQVLNILKDLQKEFGLTYLFIAHNLSVVEHVSDRVAVMYLGKMVELATRDDLFREALHPYTKALMSAIPVPNPRLKRERTILKGDVPSPLNPPRGCRFHPRCPVAIERCSQDEPQFKELRPDHWVACWVAEQNLK